MWKKKKWKDVCLAKSLKKIHHSSILRGYNVCNLIHPLFKSKKRVFHGLFCSKWLHYNCANFDKHKLAHTWKCHALSIPYVTSYLTNVSHAVQVTFVWISTQVMVVKFFFFFLSCTVFVKLVQFLSPATQNRKKGNKFKCETLG